MNEKRSRLREKVSRKSKKTCWMGQSQRLWQTIMYFGYRKTTVMDATISIRYKVFLKLLVTLIVLLVPFRQMTSRQMPTYAPNTDAIYPQRLYVRLQRMLSEMRYCSSKTGFEIVCIFPCKSLYTVHTSINDFIQLDFTSFL